MIEQILKYLPLLGLLGLIWGIIQFYQKRFYIKSDLKREEKRSYFREVDIIINDIKNEYWKFFATISQTTLLLEKKINYSNEIIDLEEKETKSTGLELDYAQELDTTTEILENIEKEGYNEEEHKIILKELLKSAKKGQKILTSSLKEKKKNLDELKANQSELKSFLENKNLKLSDKTKQTSKSLQGFILDLNKISSIGIDDKNIP
ncbi:hypothetical protein [Neptunitalea chrysea]|nr:hypothetical protein [Neptunitalea chrysea]